MESSPVDPCGVSEPWTVLPKLLCVFELIAALCRVQEEEHDNFIHLWDIYLCTSTCLY